MQQIEEDLMKDFEAEMNKITTLRSSTSINVPSTTRHFKPFWDKFLAEEFPMGQINRTLEKNFAIWIYQNDIDINAVKEMYKKNNWNPSALLGWIKKVANGDLKDYNEIETIYKSAYSLGGIHVIVEYPELYYES
jgi:hypothetical protein